MGGGFRCVTPAREPISFLDRPLPPRCRLRVVLLLPGARRIYESSEWAGELVVLERGTVEMECTRGGLRALSAGAVFWLVGLPLRALRNPGTVPAVLSAVSMVRDESSEAPRLYVVTATTTDKEGTP